MVFVRMPTFSLRYEGNGRIEDVHLFMNCLYRFWYFKGLWGSCLASFVDFLNASVLFYTVLFLTTMLDWTAALSCDELTCANATLVNDIHLPVILGVHHMLLAFILLLSSFVSLCYEFIKFIETCILQKELEKMLHGIVDSGYPTPIHRFIYLWKSMRARSEGHEEIHLTGNIPFIGNLSWGVFLDSVCERIQRDRLFGIVNHNEFDSLRAIQALMIYDNYFITLHQHGILEKGTLKYVDDNLLKVIICGMFDEFNTLNYGKDQVSLVRWQILKYFTFYILLYPFVVTLSIMRVLVKNAAMMRSDWGNYIARDWNNRARWTFRLYNEVPHILSARISIGRMKAVNMVKRLEPYSSMGRFIRRASSAIVLVTLILSFLNTSLLISGSFAGISFVWWLTIALVSFSIFSEKEPLQREYNYISDIEELIKQLHYSQDEWFLSGDAFYNALISDFLKSRFFLIISDLTRTLLMPFILIGILSDGSISTLVNCIYHESVRVDGLGSIARESAFEIIGDKNDYNNNNNNNGDFDVELSNENLPISSQFSEKCMKSVASFCSIYGKWSMKRMMATENIKKGGETPSAPASILNQFVTELHQKLTSQTLQQQQQQQQQQETFSSSVNHLPPLFIPAGSGAHESYGQSTIWEQNTAHEREQVFVSQASAIFTGESTQFSRPWAPASTIAGNNREGIPRDSGILYTTFSMNKRNEDH